MFLVMEFAGGRTVAQLIDYWRRRNKVGASAGPRVHPCACLNARIAQVCCGLLPGCAPSHVCLARLLPYAVQRVQEDYEGGSQTTVVPEGDAASLVLAPLLDALCCLHERGIVHRVRALRGAACKSQVHMRAACATPGLCAGICRKSGL